MRSATTKTKGCLLVIGGHEGKERERLILTELARRASGGALIVATAASHDKADELWDSYHRLFTELGVQEVVHLAFRSREHADAKENVALIDSASAIFFTGGDQLKLTSAIGGTRFAERMLRFYREEGGLIAGTSAGAAMMSETMLVSGRGGETHRIGEGLSMAPGLGLLPDSIIDQHFAERGRMGRLLAAVAQNPRSLGIGIDEDTAILVEGGDDFRVLGQGGVYVLDGHAMTWSNIAEAARHSALSVFDMRLHVLSHGDVFDLRTRTPVVAVAGESPERRGA